MTHDPLCVCSRKDHEHFFYTIPSDVCMACKCDDIAQVRADEREKAAQRVAEFMDSDPVERETWAQFMDALIAAARGEA